MMRGATGKKKAVCVLGPRLLQNRLVAHHLGKMTNTACSAARNPDEARSILGRTFEGVDLVLWDCGGEDLAPVVKGLTDFRSQMPANSLLALFNVASVSLRGRKVPDLPINGVFLESESIGDIAKGVFYNLYKKISVSNRTQAVLWAKGELQR